MSQANRFDIEDKLTDHQRQRAIDAVNFFLCEEFNLCRQFLESQDPWVRTYALLVLSEHSPSRNQEFARFLDGISQ